MIVIVFVAIVLFILCVIWMIPLLVPMMEPKLLFHPVRVPFYDNLAPYQTDVRVLPNGGLLLRYFGARPKTMIEYTQNSEYRSRKILFLHGNAGHIGYFLPAVKQLDALGYDVYMLEYHGYGISQKKDVSPEGVIQDLYEAWQACGDSETILMGFSLGGIVMGQGYSQLRPAPAQLVFLNTTGNMPALADELSMGTGPLLIPFMKTKKWITPPPAITEENKYMKVLIVATYDDKLIPPRHSWALHQTFKDLGPMMSTVPDGGHEVGPFAHIKQWSTWLVPAILPGYRQ